VHVIPSDSGFDARVKMNILEKRKITACIVNQTLVIKFLLK